MSVIIENQEDVCVAGPADWLDELLGRLKDEKLIPVNRLPKVLPSLRDDRPVNVSTCYRWMQEGCRGHKLKYLTIGSRRFTKVEWLREFFAALNGGTVEVVPPVPSEPKPAPPKRADQEIDRRLDGYLGPKSGKVARQRRGAASAR